MIGIMFASNEYMGFDPSIRALPDGVQTIRVNMRECRILEESFRYSMIRGRATTIFKCTLRKDGGDVVAVKDSWLIKGRRWSEAHFYRKANKEQVEFVATMIDEWVVKYENADDTTELIFGRQPETDFDVRLHSHLIIKEFGETLENFESKLEFVYALIDALTGSLLRLAIRGITHLYGSW